MRQQFEPYQMAVQISRRIHPEMPKKAALWGGEEKIGAGVSSTG
jgi:hypothetical protein